MYQFKARVLVLFFSCMEWTHVVSMQLRAVETRPPDFYQRFQGTLVSHGAGSSPTTHPANFYPAADVGPGGPVHPPVCATV